MWQLMKDMLGRSVAMYDGGGVSGAAGGPGVQQLQPQQARPRGPQPAGPPSPGPAGPTGTHPPNDTSRVRSVAEGGAEAELIIPAAPPPPPTPQQLIDECTRQAEEMVEGVKAQAKEPGGLDESTIKQIEEKAKKVLEKLQEPDAPEKFIAGPEQFQAHMRQVMAGAVIDDTVNAPREVIPAKEPRFWLNRFEKIIAQQDNATLREIRTQLADRMAQESDPKKRELYKDMLDSVHKELRSRRKERDGGPEFLLRHHERTRKQAEEIRKKAEEIIKQIPEKSDLKVSEIKLGTTVTEIHTTNGATYRLDGSTLTIQGADGKNYKVRLPAPDADPEVQKHIQALREALVSQANDATSPEYARKRGSEALERLNKGLGITEDVKKQRVPRPAPLVADIKLGMTITEMTTTNGTTCRLDGNMLTLRLKDGSGVQGADREKYIQALRDDLARQADDPAAPEYVKKKAREALERLDKALTA